MLIILDMACHSSSSYTVAQKTSYDVSWAFSPHHTLLSTRRCHRHCVVVMGVIRHRHHKNEPYGT